MIPIAKPCLGPEEERAAAEAIRSGWVSQGPKVAEFERVVADYCQVEHAVALSNCTTALHLALAVLDIGPGDEVVCPSMSFIASANAVRYTGGTPIFADVDRRTYNLDLAATRAAITSKTKAILVVHQLGLPVDLDAFHALADEFSLPIIEDAACAIGSRYRHRPIGGHSLMACFSFHPRKVITMGEGGIITTNDARLAERLRLLRQHGMSVSDAVRHRSQQVIVEEYVCLGYNYRMTDIQAAMGVEQMKKLDWIVARRRELASRYNMALAGHAWLRLPYVPDNVCFNFQSYAVQLADDAPLSRNELMQRLLDLQIHTRRGVMLAHREPAYKDLPQRHPLPHSEWASDHSILLPLYPQMTEAEQDQVIVALAEIAS